MAGFGSFTTEMTSGVFQSNDNNESQMTDETVALLEEGSEESIIRENLEYSPLVSYIEGRFQKAESARLFDEERWIEAYRNFRGIYAPQNAFTSTEKSRIFIRATKMKVNAAYSQITETLFANNRFPIGVEATLIPEGIEESVHFDPKDPDNQPSPAGGMGPETSATIARPDILKSLGPLKETLEPIQDKLKPGSSASPSAINFEPEKAAAELMDKKIRDQLEEANADKSLRAFCFELCLLGTGVFKGPILKTKEYPKWDITGAYTPLFNDIADVQQVSLWDAYPDPEARNNAEELEFFIQRHRLTKSQLLNLKKRPAFRPESVEAAVKGGFNYQEKWWEATLRDFKSNSPTERYEVLEFWGMVDSDFEDFSGIKTPPQYKDLDQVHIS